MHALASVRDVRVPLIAVPAAAGVTGAGTPSGPSAGGLVVPAVQVSAGAVAAVA